MTVSTKLFPSVLIDAANVEYMREEGAANGFLTPLAEHCGYTLIQDLLVPETFIQHVMAELSQGNFDYGFVLGKADLFEKEFLDSLDEFEQLILMPVVLQIIARDKFPLNLWAALAQDDDCEADVL